MTKGYLTKLFSKIIGILQMKRTAMENMDVNVIGLVFWTNFSHYIEEHRKQTSNDFPELAESMQAKIEIAWFGNSLKYDECE